MPYAVQSHTLIVVRLFFSFPHGIMNSIPFKKSILESWYPIMAFDAQTLLQEAKALQEELVSIRRDIHAHPELGSHEVRTTEVIRSYLESLGIEIRPCLETGVLGILYGGQPGKTIGLRADIDALPIQEATGLEFASQNDGVMHACGHDLHATALMGAAKILAAHRNELHGNVKFFFQPDEEGSGGAERMVKAGCLQNPKVDAVFGGHSSTGQLAGQYGLKYGKTYAASNPFVIRVHGQGCHGAYPANGIDSIAVACQIVSALQMLVSRRISATDSAVVTVGSFHAGTAGNIIAGEAELKGIIRTLGPQMREKMCRLVKETAEGVASALGASAEVEIRTSYPGVVNEDAFTTFVHRVMISLVGEQGVTLKATPNMGTEDFGYFMDGIPGCYCAFGFGDGGKECRFPAHGPYFRANEDGLAYAAALHAAVAMQYLNENV